MGTIRGKKDNEWYSFSRILNPFPCCSDLFFPLYFLYHQILSPYQDEFEKFWSVASKIVPLPSTNPTEQNQPSPSRAPSLNLSLSGNSTHTNGTSASSNEDRGPTVGGEKSKFSTISSTSTARPNPQSQSLGIGSGIGNESQVSLNPSIGGESVVNNQDSNGNKALNSIGGGSGLDKNDANNVRSVPVRIHLRDCPVVQEPIAPIQEDGESKLASDRSYLFLFMKTNYTNLTSTFLTSFSLRYSNNITSNLDFFISITFPS